MPSEKGGRRLWIHKEQMQIRKWAWGVHTHVCRAVVRAEMRMLSQHQRASTAIDRRVFSVRDHREAWARGFWPRTGIAEPLEEWPCAGCVDLAEVSWGWRFCSMYSNCWHIVIAPSLWSGRKEEEGNERKKGSREGRKGGRQWVPGRLQARYLGRRMSQVRSSLWGKEERTLLSGIKAPYIQSFWTLVSYLSNIGYKLFKEYLYY